MYLLAWTVRKEFANRDEYEDHYEVYSGIETAQKAFRLLLEEGVVWCAAITKVMDATEPHWMDDVSGSLDAQCPPTDGESE